MFMDWKTPQMDPMADCTRVTPQSDIYIERAKLSSATPADRFQRSIFRSLRA